MRNFTDNKFGNRGGGDWRPTGGRWDQMSNFQGNRGNQGGGNPGMGGAPPSAGGSPGMGGAPPSAGGAPSMGGAPPSSGGRGFPMPPGMGGGGFPMPPMPPNPFAGGGGFPMPPGFGGGGFPMPPGFGGQQNPNWNDQFGQGGSIRGQMRPYDQNTMGRLPMQQRPQFAGMQNQGGRPPFTY